MNINIFSCLMLMLFLLAPAVWAGETIAYSHLSEDGYWQIWEMVSDGSGARQITRSKQDKREPSWILDGRIVYRTNNSKVFISSRDGSSESEILAKYQRVNHPQFSHDGTHMLFTRFDPRFKDIRDIWKTDVNGDNAVILTRDHKQALQPVFAPDDKSVAFVNSDETKKHHIWVMDADGNNAKQLTKGQGQDFFPKFSPDGQSITFSSDREDGNFEIYVVNVKTKAVKRLTHDAGLDTNSCFSPDGEKVAFVSGRGGNQQIWVMDKDGANPMQLTRAEGESLEPHWADIKEGEAK